MGTRKPAASLSETMQHFIDLGLIDSWLRGLANIVPHRQETSHRTSPLLAGDFNTHMVGYENPDIISAEKITHLRGFQSLLQKARQKNIAFSCYNASEGYLKIVFHPEKGFTETRIFGQPPDAAKADTIITFAPAITKAVLRQ